MRDCFDLAPDVEWTMEANPASVTKEKMLAALSGGVNRVSLGAQSLSDDVLAFLGRAHTRAQLETAVEAVKTAGFDKWNLDLITALPGQTAEAWGNTLKEAIAFAPTHISCYSLICDPQTPLGRMAAKGEIVLPDDEQERAMVHLTEQTLARAGYEQYEISNFALPGHACRHNINYWECGDYIGLGCAAHSLFRGARKRNTPSLPRYLTAADPTEETQTLSDRDKREERVFLGLRMNRGVDIARFERDFALDFHAFYASALQTNLDRGFLEEAEGFLRLTARGRDFCDTVAAEFMETA